MLTTTRTRTVRVTTGEYRWRGSKQRAIVAVLGAGDVITLRFKRTRTAYSLHLYDALIYAVQRHVDAARRQRQEERRALRGR